MVAILLAPALLAGCLSGDLPELPDQLRVRDADLPGLTMYLNVTEKDGRFHLYAVTANEGEETYNIGVSDTSEDGKPCPRGPYTSDLQRAGGGYRSKPGLIRPDSCSYLRETAEPGDHYTFEATWPDPEGVLPSEPGTYIWKVGFRVSGEPHEPPGRLVAQVVLEVPASMVHPAEGNATAGNGTGDANASGST